MNDCGVIVFVKEPVPGKVKTRLAADIGDQAAADAYRCIAETLAGNLRDLKNITLACSPPDACGMISNWLGAAHRCVPQADGDLGIRMSAAFSEAFAAGHRKVVLIGSDCPDVFAANIEAASSALTDHDVVLGPADDGGYWLIGMRSPNAGLFQNIGWSTPGVLEQTLDRCREASLRTRLLATKTDIDTADEWFAFKKRDISR